ncbi:MAG: hypothetical protein ACK56W_10440 [Pirellula sp.]
MGLSPGAAAQQHLAIQITQLTTASKVACIVHATMTGGRSHDHGGSIYGYQISQ